MCEAKWEAVLNSRILSNYFKELCRKFSPPYRETSVKINRQKAQTNKELIFCLTQARRLIREGKVDDETFKHEIKKILDLNVLHIEILWYSEVCEIMTLMEYIQFQEVNNNEDVIEHVAGKIFENLLEYKTNPLEVRKQLLLFFFGNILRCSNKSKKSFYQVQMSLFIKNFKEVCSLDENCDVEGQLDMTQLSELLDNFDPDVVKKFYEEILSGLLEDAPQSIRSAFKKQDKIKNEVKGKKIYQFFIKMSKCCDLSFMVELLQRILLESSIGINWNHMFCFISFIGTHYKDGWNSLKAVTSLIIKMAFQKLNEKLLSYGFLIARQGCFERFNKSFPGYVQWFGSTFSTESRRPVNSKKTCEFFFKFLTDSLPYDSAYYLKVHINRAPSVPTDCLSILQEYVEAVKSHLSDLNVSVELGICENTTDKSAAVFDVEKVLKHFETTNDILHSVFHSAMFCKEYYEKKFLVELLSKFEGKKSVRHKFIVKLNSLGKIPNSMFKTYKGLEKKS